jgi:lysophospholipase L1-like esterase
MFRRCILVLSGVVLALTWVPDGAAAAEPKKARVLIVGDSISMGYGPYVKKNLADEADVFRPIREDGRDENCAGTTHGVARINAWLASQGGNWDVIHFNFGLHDLKAEDPETKKASNNPEDPHQAEPEVYRRQLTEIVQKLKATNAKLIYATTTPVPEGKLRPHRSPADCERYNAIAREIMEANDVPINDLYAFAKPRLNEIQQPANVHFTKAGSEALGKQVAAAIREQLNQ